MVRRVLSLTMRNIPLLLSYITMKKILLIFLLLLITAYSHSQQFVGSGGSGTEDDPFLIENYNDFVEFRSLFYNATQYTRNKYFQLVADIAIESDFWNNPIQGSFYGYFNGKGHILLLPDTLNNYDNVFYTFFIYNTFLCFEIEQCQATRQVHVWPKGMIHADQRMKFM